MCAVNAARPRIYPIVSSGDDGKTSAGAKTTVPANFDTSALFSPLLPFMVITAPSRTRPGIDVSVPIRNGMHSWPAGGVLVRFSAVSVAGDEKREIEHVAALRVFERLMS
jgi:hypothetical protein